jgi:hypothetical protein
MQVAVWCACLTCALAGRPMCSLRTQPGTRGSALALAPRQWAGWEAHAPESKQPQVRSFASWRLEFTDAGQCTSASSSSVGRLGGTCTRIKAATRQTIHQLPTHALWSALQDSAVVSKWPYKKLGEFCGMKLSRHMHVQAGICTYIT